MFRVCAVSVLTLGSLLASASTQAQQPGPYMDPAMQLPPAGFGPQGLPPQGPPLGFDPGYAQAMYNAPLDGSFGVAPMQYQGGPPPQIAAGEPISAPYGAPYAGGYGGPDCGCAGPCDGGCGCGCAPPCHEPCLPCCEPCPCPGCPVVCSAEVEATFLFMDIDGTEAAGQIDAPSIPVGALFLSEDADLDDELTMSPRIWLHAQKCEWGVGARLWNLDDSEADFTALDLLNFNIIGNYQLERLEALTGDVELTYSWRFGSHHYGLLKNIWVQSGVGLRYAEYENDALILANGTFGSPGDRAIAHASGVARTQFDGTGITYGMRGTFCMTHCASLYWGVRGSYIWGDMTNRVQTAATAIYEVDPAAGAIDSAGISTEEELFIGEAQLGIQWEHQLRCLPARAFFRVAAEYQLWEINSDAFVFSESIVQVDVLPNDAVIASAQALAEAPNLDLFGLSVATGIMW